VKQKIILNVCLSACFIYLAFRQVNYQELKVTLGAFEKVYLFPMILVSGAIQLVRSYRWREILRPLKPLGLGTVYVVNSVGFAAINLLPARLGEILRPYLMAKQGDIPLSSVLGTLIVERILDSVALLFYISIVVLFGKVPDWVNKAGYLLLGLTLILLLLVALLLGRKERVLVSLLHRRISASSEAKLISFLVSFKEGFKALPDTEKLLRLVLISLLLWSLPIFSIYLLFLAFHFQLPFVAAWTVFIFISLGIMIPSAPGFVGNFQFFCMAGLSLYGIPKPDALAYSIILNFVQFSTIVLQGLLMFSFIKVPLGILLRTSSGEVSNR